MAVFVAQLPCAAVSCCGLRGVPLLLVHRCVLSALCCWQLLRFSATQHSRDTDNPEKTPVTPLLLRCLALLLASLAAYVVHAVALRREAPIRTATRIRPPLLPTVLPSLTHSFAVLAASIHLVCALLSPRPPLASLLPTAVFSLHAAWLCLPFAASSAPAAQAAAPISAAPASPLDGAIVPLLCAWLSCYWLALDHDDKWQIWPLAPLLALHASHTALALLHVIKAQCSGEGRHEALKSAYV